MQDLGIIWIGAGRYSIGARSMVVPQSGRGWRGIGSDKAIHPARPGDPVLFHIRAPLRLRSFCLLPAHRGATVAMTALSMSQYTQPQRCGMQTLHRPACRAVPAAAMRSRQMQVTCRAHKVGPLCLATYTRHGTVASDVAGVHGVLDASWNLAQHCMQDRMHTYMPDRWDGSKAWISQPGSTCSSIPSGFVSRHLPVRCAARGAAALGQNRLSYPMVVAADRMSPAQCLIGDLRGAAATFGRLCACAGADAARDRPQQSCSGESAIHASCWVRTMGGCINGRGVRALVEPAA